MSDIAWIWRATTGDVYYAIYNQHKDDFTVHETCTRMEDGPYMLTAWGFRDADAPIIKCVRNGDDFRYFIACHITPREGHK